MIGIDDVLIGLAIGGVVSLFSGCSEDEGSHETNPDASLNDAGVWGNPGQGTYNANACQLPAKNADGTQGYLKDVYISSDPTQANQCATVQSALEIADKNGATVHFVAGDVHKEAFTVPSLFKQLTFKTDVTETNKSPAVLTPSEQEGQTIMTIESVAQPVAGSTTPAVVPMIEVSNVTFDGLQNNNAIELKGGTKPEHKDDYNLQLSDVRIQDAKQGLVVGGSARVLAQNLDVDHPEQAVSLGSGTEAEFYNLQVHDMAGSSNKAVFEAKDADSVKMEGFIFSNLTSSEPLMNIKTKLAWIYGGALFNNEIFGPLVQLDLDHLFKPEENKEHQVGNLLIANNQGSEEVIHYQTDDRATLHNIHISKNEGNFNHAIGSAGNTAPSTIVNSNITDNQSVNQEAISGADVSGPTAVEVHGTNIFNNTLMGGNENIYGADNYSMPYCGKSTEGIIFNQALNILFPNAFEIGTTDHEQCALAQGGATYASWTNNVDGTNGHVGISGGWKADLMSGVYDGIKSLYNQYIQQQP